MLPFTSFETKSEVFSELRWLGTEVTGMLPCLAFMWVL